ncbi:HAD-IC family P-type ATPase [Leifsonia sp. AG29]|uniref:HAD-IC family P-type ATPase n=1 Tax=Leifsonia sp. AG29 TaxID=2598860 RepID=UPI001E574EF5|nr:HAD-IC family P-type ATPase [Leifsonia sp. AG29]
MSAAEVAQRVADGRTNRYRPRTSRSLASIARANVLTLFNAIIAACFVVLLLIGRWQDALFGIAAAGNIIIGSWQELRAKAALDRLALPSAAAARVIREGGELEIPTETVVADDLLVVRVGDRVAADARVVFADGLQTDESLLTGESDAIDKVAGDLVLGGSVVVGGAGRARVERVGADTFAHGLAAQARRFSLVSSELHAGIQTVLRWVAWAVGPLGLLVFNAQVVSLGGWRTVMSSELWRDAVVYTVAAVVAMIPLGLVLMTSIAFAVAAVRLGRRGILVQELAAAEVLARVDIVCFDKTGTLTEGEVRFDEAIPLAGAAGRGGWPGVLAWFGAAEDANATARSLAERYPSPVEAVPVSRVPFSSVRRWSAVSFDGPVAGTWVLGGADVVFADGRLEERVRALVDAGRRTLVLAHASAALTAEARLPSGLEPVALLTFRERVRPDVAETLSYFAREGVGLRVLSGDDPRTVAAIAKEAGLAVSDGFDARLLPEEPDRVEELLRQELVLGRVTPDQKRRIAAALQAAGHVVAMIGDGVNDIPALKQADIGIAVSTGAEASKAVARMVLLDGRFSSLPAAVGEGRQVMANIERVSMLFLTKTVYATLLALLVGVLVTAYPFLPRQLAATDGLTIGLPAFFLALLPNLRRHRAGFLARSLSFAVPVGGVIGSVLIAYSWSMAELGIGEEQLRTGATMLLAILGLWVLAMLARPWDGRKLFVVASMAAGVVLIFTVPVIRTFLVFVDVPPPVSAGVVVFASLGAALIEIARAARRGVSPPPRAECP